MKKLAEFFKALGDENRLKIVQMLAEKEMCVCEVIDRLDLSQPAISHHLKILRQAGLVKDTKEGKWVYYALEESAFIKYGEELSKILGRPIPEKIPSGSIHKPQTRTDCSLCEKLTAQQEALDEALGEVK